MSPLPSDLREQLQKEYASTFDDKARDLDSAFAAKDQQKLKVLFHKLVGSGKTYEMDDISHIAKACEDVLATSFPEDKIKNAITALKEIFSHHKSQLR